MIYPKIMTSISGQKINDVAMWEKYRKAEILNLFSNFVYGVSPIGRPKDLSFSVECIERENNITQKKVSITFSNYTICANVFVPKGNTKKLPAYLLIVHQYQEEQCNLDESLDYEFMPVYDILERGYALITMDTSNIHTDLYENGIYKGGIFDVLDENRQSNSWSIISSWAWGASRVLDYLETDTDIDSKKVAVIGHSRGGKTALWTAAQDERFAMAVSNNSGCTGAAITRGKVGEHIVDINITNWFCENYKKYNDNEDMLPVDQHMLLALLAPRPIYISSSSDDDWADPKSEFLSCTLASSAYKLYGKKGLVAPKDGAEIDISYQDGFIGYHNKTGQHSLTKYDWNLFMDFSDKRF